MSRISNVVFKSTIEFLFYHKNPKLLFFTFQNIGRFTQIMAKWHLKRGTIDYLVKKVLFYKDGPHFFNLFKRGASKAAAGRFASVAAKLVKTATQIPIYIRVK